MNGKGIAHKKGVRRDFDSDRRPLGGLGPDARAGCETFPQLTIGLGIIVGKVRHLEMMGSMVEEKIVKGDQDRVAAAELRQLMEAGIQQDAARRRNHAIKL
jgi:hypothetical protein